MQHPHTWTTGDILALALARTKSSVLRHLVEHYTSLDEATAVAEAAQSGLFTDNRTALLRTRAQQQTELCSRNGVDIHTYWDDSYPALLRLIAYPPPVLFVRGTLRSAHTPAIAIVGTRKSTPYGKLTTEQFADAFAHSGAIVVSGLAAGIDTAAHTAAIRASGTTYAVIASGIDTASTHTRALSEDISSSGGAIISEYACGVRARPAYFPQRNRIISGIAQATLVVESGLRGGALITAAFATEQRRKLYAIPGAITWTQSSGTNALIRSLQATAALSPEDILRDLGIFRTAVQPSEALFVGLSHKAQHVYNSISRDPVHIDDIAERSGTSVHDLLVYLLDLEFRGLVQQLPGRQFVRI